MDATCLRNKRGYGRHARSLLTALARIDAGSEYAFVVDFEEALQDLPGNVRVHRVECTRPSVAAAAWDNHRSLRDMWRVSRALSDRSCDLLLFPTIYTFVPVLSRARKIVMIHDVIPETFPELTLPTLTSRLFWSLKTAVGRRQADALVTVSEFSRRKLASHFGIDLARIHVVGEASDPVFRLRQGAAPTALLSSLGIAAGVRLVVCVGGFGRHKNLEMLVEVFSRIAAREEFADVRLALVGEYKEEAFLSHHESLFALARDLGVRDRLIFTGFLPDEELATLLNIATVLVLPSLMEGFGLPAVEAAACGCPVVATTASPLPSLLGGGALYFDPRQAAELEAALTKVLESPDLRKSMRESALEAARNLTWDAAARTLKSLMNEVMAH